MPLPKRCTSRQIALFIGCFVCAVSAVVPCVVRGAEIQPLKVLVANYDEAWTYSVDPAAGVVSLLTHTPHDPNEKASKGLITALNEIRDRKEARQQEATQPLMQQWSDATWADVSPNCKYAVIGNENIAFDVLYHATLVETQSPHKIDSIALHDFNYFLDFGWSDNSQYLVIIDTEERYSRSPLGLLARAIGHGIPLETLYARVIDTTTGQEKRVLVAKDVPYGTVAIYGAESSCK
jgi:hypothetical protein